MCIKSIISTSCTQYSSISFLHPFSTRSVFPPFLRPSVLFRSSLHLGHLKLGCQGFLQQETQCQLEWIVSGGRAAEKSSHSVAAGWIYEWMSGFLRTGHRSARFLLNGRYQLYLQHPGLVYSTAVINSFPTCVFTCFGVFCVLHRINPSPSYDKCWCLCDEMKPYGRLLMWPATPKKESTHFRLCCKSFSG